MNDIQTLLDLLEDLPIEALEQLQQFMHKNRQSLQDKLSTDRDQTARMITLGRELNRFRREFEDKNPNAIDPDAAYFQQRLAELMEHLPSDDLNA